MTAARPQLTIEGLIAELLALGRISESEPPVVTRVVFGEADMRARAYVKSLCHAAGLKIREDAIGNTFARWEGQRPDLSGVATATDTSMFSYCKIASSLQEALAAGTFFSASATARITQS